MEPRIKLNKKEIPKNANGMRNFFNLFTTKLPTMTISPMTVYYQVKS